MRNTDSSLNHCKFGILVWVPDQRGQGSKRRVLYGKVFSVKLHALIIILKISFKENIGLCCLVRNVVVRLTLYFAGVTPRYSLFS